VSVHIRGVFGTTPLSSAQQARSPTKHVYIMAPGEEHRPGRSGYPISSGLVIRVLKNSGNENCYPKSAPK
jgi:hypothetical protein